MSDSWGFIVREDRRRSGSVRAVRPSGTLPDSALSPADEGRRRGRGRRPSPWWLSVALALMGGGSAAATDLLVYDFATGLGPSTRDPSLAYASPLDAAWSSPDVNGAAVADDWDQDEPANYFYFTVVVERGFAVDLEQVIFDYLSEKGAWSFWLGPSSYEVRIGVGAQPFVGLSGGWQAMEQDGLWHRGIVAGQGGASLTNLSGVFTIAIAARGAFDPIAKLSVDNLRLVGTVRSLDAAARPSEITAFSRPAGLLVGNLDSNRFYTLESSADLQGAWSKVAQAVNLQSAAPSIAIAPPADGGPRTFYRIVSSGTPLPAADLGGLWQVSSTGAYFRSGVIRMFQHPSHAWYEDLMVGSMSGHGFSLGHHDGNMVGSVDGDSLSATYYGLMENGTSMGGSFTATRYTGPAYELWEGDAILTHAQCFNPAANGYSRILQASTTATATLSRSTVLLVAVAPTLVDAFQGSDGGYLVGISANSGNTSGLTPIYGAEDGVCAEVGTGYSGADYRGYITFRPPGWTTIRVVVGP